ncbi:unnamed protein product [Ectocarpus sp. CCAP 1310/34]|nr:unnamed protein product [Ectocarpus sp. CCAP 1310/34]
MIRDFAATFEGLGLSPAYCGTAYGLAEHVVGVCAHEANLGGRPLSELTDEDLECVGQLERLSDGSKLKIVDPKTRREVALGEVGELWLSSPSVAAGYWGQPELTEEAFNANVVGEEQGEGSDNPTGTVFLRTGDLARVEAGGSGRLFISGRIKDLIIVRGRNLYPQDVEFAVQEACSMVRPGCVAAFSTTELGGELEVVLEVRQSAEGDPDGLSEGLEAIRRAIASEGCYPSRVVAIKEKTIPKTTSGKIQRRRSREMLHQGALSVIAELTAPRGSSCIAEGSTKAAAAVSGGVVAAAASTSSESGSEPSSLSSSLSSWVSASVPVPPRPASSCSLSSEASDAAAAAAAPVASPTASQPPAGGPEDAATAGSSDPLGTNQEWREGLRQEQLRGPRGAGDDDAGAAAAGRESSDGDASLLSRQKGERLEALTMLVVGTATGVLKGRAISPDQALFDAGFDSITAEEFVGRLQERLSSEGWVSGGLPGAEAVVSSTTVFDCPTARHIAEHVEGALSKTGAGDDVATGGPQASTESGDGGGRGRGHSLAVVGMSCRFPGGCDSPEAFWDFLRKGADATSGVPSDRWSTSTGEGMFTQEGPPANGKPGNIETRGGFLSEGEAWGFDDSFFGVPPAEARCMDPQQRMMLEVGYEALHRAGFTRDSLRGSDTGIFVGACGTDWATLLAEGGAAAPRGPYTSTGAASSMLANRLSFTLGTVGPSMTVDTACSSSLVALRQACLHLRGEGGPRVALVGGVNLLLSPGPFDLFSKTGMLAPDGRSKAFSAGADGYGRGEGCGAVVLKRLEDATKDGDRVLAVIKGSAVGHNGRSATLTAPNGTSQKSTIAAALREAGIAPKEVSYVEAHGTGTALGDPVEFGALKAVYGPESHNVPAPAPACLSRHHAPDRHLEGAAGISGLIKTILVLAHGSAPPNLHASEVNPRIDLSSLPAVLPAPGAPTRLLRPRPRRGRGPVTSFFSAGGDEEQERGNPQEEEGGRGGEASLGDGPRPPLLGAVSSFGFGGTNAHVVLEGKDGAFGGGEGGAPSPVPGVAFLFTGQGSQYPGMGRELYESYGEFRAIVDACDEELAGVLPRRLLSVLYGDEKDAAKLLATTRYAQPALFAVECATAATLRAAGVVPAAVMGHSLGELAAACAAGVMTLREGVRLVAERGRLMDDDASTTGGAGESETADEDGPECMAAVRSPESAALAAAALHGGGGRVSVAAVNGADSVVLSGPRRLVEMVSAAALASSSPSPPPTAEKQAGPAAVDVRDSGPGNNGSSSGGSLSALGLEANGGGGGAGVNRNPSGFSTRHMSWLAGAKAPVVAVAGGGGGKAAVDGSESTGSVSPSIDSEEAERTNAGSDTTSSTDGAMSDGALSDGPLSDDAGLLSGGGGGGVPRIGGRASPPTSSPRKFSGDKSLPPPPPSNGHSACGNGGATAANGHAEPYGAAAAAAAAAGVCGGQSTGDNATASASFLDLPADRFRMLQGVSRAFHSPAMAAAAAGTEAAARRVSLRDPDVPLASNVTGRLAREGELTDPAYWGRHVLGTVRFHDGLTTLTTSCAAQQQQQQQQAAGSPLSERITTFVEVGPSALLCRMGRRALRAAPGASCGGGGARDRAAVADSPRWMAAMSPDERAAGKRGLGHVVGAVRGVHYRRRSYPWINGGSAASTPAEPKAVAAGASRRNGGDRGRRPPLRLLETKWVRVGELSSSGADGSVEGGRKRSDSTAMAAAEAGGGGDVVDGEPPLTEEVVWLLAGRTDASYASLSDAVSSDDGGKGGCLAHLLTVGPTAAGGETAAIARLERYGFL